MRRAPGFTLIELMIALVLVAIVATVAVPAWSDFVRRNRLAAATNEFVTALNYTRSEAVRRNADVSLCPSADQSSCADTTDWSDGWIAFIGADSDDPDPILRVWSAVEGNGTLESAASTQIIYRGDGSTESTASFDLELQGCMRNEHRDITVTRAGRPRVQESACD